MLPASNRGAGMNIGFPDVCLTPAAPSPIPIPYPNLAMHAQAAPFAATVMISMMNGLNMGSAIPMTTGDNAGVAHPFFMQRGAFTMGHPLVFIEKLPGIMLTVPTTGNMMNNPVGAVLVPSVTTVFFSLRQDESSIPLENASVQSESWIGPGVALLRLAVFEAKTPSLVYSAIRRLKGLNKSGGARSATGGGPSLPLEKLVMDLRGNPGGDLEASTQLLSDFLPAGTILYQLEDVDGDTTEVRANGEQLYDLPLEVWVDGNTGSAAEVFAMSIQANRRGRIVGEPTFGKGTVTRLVGSTQAACGRVLFPDGSPLDGVGVKPD